MNFGFNFCRSIVYFAFFFFLFLFLNLIKIKSNFKFRGKNSLVYHLDSSLNLAAIFFSLDFHIPPRICVLANDNDKQR